MHVCRVPLTTPQVACGDGLARIHRHLHLRQGWCDSLHLPLHLFPFQVACGDGLVRIYNFLRSDEPSQYPQVRAVRWLLAFPSWMEWRIAGG